VRVAEMVGLQVYNRVGLGALPSGHIRTIDLSHTYPRDARASWSPSKQASLETIIRALRARASWGQFVRRPTQGISTTLRKRAKTAKPHGSYRPHGRNDPMNTHLKARPACNCPPKGRCRLHGGLSTGAKTAEGIERIRRARTIHGRFSKRAKAERAAYPRSIAGLPGYAGGVVVQRAAPDPQGNSTYGT
jgi:hypothetical protein